MLFHWLLVAERSTSLTGLQHQRTGYSYNLAVVVSHFNHGFCIPPLILSCLQMFFSDIVYFPLTFIGVVVHILAYRIIAHTVFVV